MRRILVLCAITAMAVTFCAAQSGGYLLINNDNANANTADIDTVSSTGALALLTTVQTGGTGVGGGFYFMPRNAVSQNLKCFFVGDSESNDIAAFQIPSLHKVATNFTNINLNAAAGFGLGLAVSPNNKFLYSAWPGSENLAVLSIAPDCSLTMVGAPIAEPDGVGDITITRDGKVLVVSFTNLGGAQAYTLNANTGAMTPLGTQLDFNTAIPECAKVGCYPTEMDVDNSDQFWVWGNASLAGPSVLTAQLTTHGFINAGVTTFNSNTTLQSVQGPWLSPAARAGNGNLYLGAMGFGTGYPAGIIVANFHAGVVTYESGVINSAAYYAGNVQTIGKTGTGSPITQIWSDSLANNTLQSYTVSGTTLTPASSLKTTSTGSFASSTTAVGR